MPLGAQPFASAMPIRTARRHLALLLVLLLLGGCGGKRALTVYLPEGESLRAVSVRAENSPRGLMDALRQAGALPEADWEYLYCDCREDAEGRRLVQLDIADALGNAYSEMEDERPAVQALANSFLSFYDADALVLTVEGVILQTLRAYYDHEILFDEYAKTLAG